MLCLRVLLLVLCLSGWVKSHGHSHENGQRGHSHEPAEDRPWQKYSKEANDPEYHEHGHHQESHDIPDKDQFEHLDQDRRPTDGRKYYAEEPRSHSKFSKQHQEHNKVAVWTMALAATLVISIAPALLLFLLPVDNSKEYKPWLRVFLSYAAGGLLGDAFLHLIPHATLSTIDGDEHGHGHSHADGDHSHDISVGLWVIAGIMCFLIMEKMTRYFRGEGAHGHSHGAKTAPTAAAKKKKDDDLGAGDSPRKGSKETHAGGLGKAKPAAYLNLIADFFHNFTDGLAIGASFLVNGKTGIITAITVLFHEIPHEIGDLAILIQSGLTKMEAIKMQMLTAIGAILGTILGLCMESLGSWAISGILPFTAGGFIYLATVIAIPELLEDIGFFQSLVEIIGFGVGVALMTIISFYE